MTPPMLLVLLGFTEVIHSQEQLTTKINYIWPCRTLWSQQTFQEQQCQPGYQMTHFVIGFGYLVTGVEKCTKAHAGTKHSCNHNPGFFRWNGTQKRTYKPARETEIEKQGLLSWKKPHKSLTPLSWNDLLLHVENKPSALMSTFCRPKAKLKLMLPINEG